MASGSCDQCGVEEYMPYVCKFCKGRYCAAHRLPENHNCAGLDAHRERVRAEGRVFAPPQDARVTPRVSTGARAGASLDAFWSKVDGKMTWIILGICIGVYLIEELLYVARNPLLFDLFYIKSNFIVQPWTILTSIFAHDPLNLNHLFLNMIALIFFGASVEKLLGTKRYTYLFLGAGAIAGMAEVVIEVVLGHPDVAALGASGALMGLMGALVVLAPTLTVLVFFVIPAPLWALVALYVVLDLVGAFTPGSTVAHFAHLTGLAIGLAYGYYLRKQGLRAIVRKAPPMWNR
ncbi:MAG: rhomboid family intramembrane serine protease [Candidatus Thermoplasmatota archaeon]